MTKFLISLSKKEIDLKNIKNLLIYQKKSFSNLFKKNKLFSINYILNDIFPVCYKNTTVKLVKYEIKSPKKSFTECKKNFISFCYKIFITLIFINDKDKTKYLKNIFFCNIPIMNNNCSFLINGIERTIISQTCKSPGVYFEKNRRFSKATIIPIMGDKIMFKYDFNGKMSTYINNIKKSVNYIFNIFNIKTEEIFNNKECCSTLIYKNNKFFLSYYNNNNFFEISEKKIIKYRIYKNISFGKTNLKFGETLKKNFLEYIKNKNVKKKVKIFEVFLKNYTKNKNIYNEKNFTFSKIGRKIVNNKIGIKNNNNISIDKETIIITIKRLIDKKVLNELIDNIDDLKNKRVICCGESIYNSIKRGINSCKKSIVEKLKFSKKETIINFNQVNNSVKDFFCSSNISQFLEQTNLLSEITHKRRISFIGNIKNVPKKIREINNSFYGKICPIETPEGQNIGLVNSPTMFCRINSLGFFKTPYIRKLDNKIVFLYQYQEENMIFSDGKKFKLKKKDNGKEETFSYIRYNNKAYITLNKFIDFYDICKINSVSLASLFIPFLEYNEPNRVLMGANMQRQAIPSQYPSYPYVITGMEKILYKNLNYIYKSNVTGNIIFKDSEKIIIKKNNENKIKIFKIPRYYKTNQNTIFHNIVNVKRKEVKKGDVISKSINNVNEIFSLGNNLLVALMPWKGYNYEDSIVISEKVLRKDYFTSIHIECVEFSIKDINFEEEKITNKLPNVSKKNKKKLSKNGIIKIGSFVKTNDILIGKVKILKKCFSPEEKLINIVKKKKKKKEKEINCSYKTPQGVKGIVTKIVFIKNNTKSKKKEKYIIKKKNILLSRKKKKEENFKNIKTVVIYITTKKTLSVGDKMSGRYGNKGVLAKILPEYKMPFTKDGDICDIILNPLSVPSRMNIGQLIELKCGFLIFIIKKYIKIYKDKTKKLYNIIKKIFKKDIKNRKEILKFSKNLYNKIIIQSTPFEKKNLKKITKMIRFILKDKAFKNFEFKENSKVTLMDGISCRKFKKPISIGYMYYLKLYHTVDTKIHARSIGPYSLITQQPLKGKSQFGGQRLGEMEVWALEAYGAAQILLEMLTIKSDDIKSREEKYKYIIKKKKSKTKKETESFKTLIKEITSFGINVNYK
ncbi:DNA-directed RNA polymerase subunit beta [Candidatus Vidania fulgoroideorum]